MSRDASAALVHLASLLAARAELRLEVDSATHPTPGVSLLASFEDSIAKAEQRYIEAWHAAPAAVLPADTPEPVRFAQPEAAQGVWTEIESLAEQKRASDPSLTKEAAVSKVMSEQPALYQRYVAAGGR